MRLFRLIVFSLCVGIFLVGCPLVILYALGYAFNPSGPEGIVKTGLIAVSTSPPSALVYLGRRRYTQRTPTILRDLRPGQYPVTLALKHYKSWSRVVRVEAEKATVLDHILLVPQQWKPKVAVAQRVEEVIPIPGTPYLLLTKGPTVEDIVIYDGREETYRPLVLTGFAPPTARIKTLAVIRDSPTVLLRAESREGQHMLWIEPRAGEPAVEDISHLFPETPDRVEWDPRDRRHLFSLRDGFLSRLDLVTQAIYPKIVDQVRGYGVFGKALYVLKEDGTLWRMDRDGKQAQLLVDDLDLSRLLGRLRGPVDIAVVAEDLLLILGGRGELLSNRSPYQLAERGIEGLARSAQHQRVLIWQKDRLGLLEIESEGAGPEMSRPMWRLQWVYQGDRAIEQALWVDDASHILLQDSGRLILLELEAEGPPRVEPLLELRRKHAMAYVEDAGILYYLDHASGYLYALQLVPKRERLGFPQ